MPVLSCIIKKSFKSIHDFFQEIKKYGVTVQRVKAVVIVSQGLEVVFLQQTDLEAFVAQAPSEWEVVSDLNKETLVTLNPRFGVNHFMIDDVPIIMALQRYGEVTEGKHLVYKDFPLVETGVRQFKIKLKEKALPSSLRFGSAGFLTSYRGQVKTCHRCGSRQHLASDCNVKNCFRCGSADHEQSTCNNQIVCVACGESGHPFSRCEKAFSNRLKKNIGAVWGKVEKAEGVLHVNKNIESSSSVEVSEPTLNPNRKSETKAYIPPVVVKQPQIEAKGDKPSSSSQTSPAASEDLNILTPETPSAPPQTAAAAGLFDGILPNLDIDLTDLQHLPSYNPDHPPPWLDSSPSSQERGDFKRQKSLDTDFSA